MAQMPDIKPEINQSAEEDRKKPGFFASLFGGGGASGGGAVGLGGAAAGGGMLATKAGLIGLIVIGSAVAGGIGLVGYRAFGPGDSDKMGGNLSLFAPKPKQAAADPNAVAPVAADGSSQSLGYLVSANKDANGGASEATTDQTSASSTGDAGSSATNAGTSNGPLNAVTGDGAVGNMSKALQGTKKLGELSKAGGGASSTAGASVGTNPNANLGALGPNAARNSATSGLSRGSQASLATGSRSIGRRSNNATRQALGVLRDNRGAGSSFAAGRTYDGSAVGSTGEIGTQGGEISGGGLGLTGSGAAQPRSMPNSAPNLRDYEPATPEGKHMITPWEKTLGQAQMMILLAVGLSMLAKKLTIPWLKILIGAAITAIGAYVMYLGSKVAFGEHGQALQGSLVLAAGAGVTIMGIMAMGFMSEPTSGVGSGMLADITWPVALAGGLGLMSMISGMFMKPKQIEVDAEDVDKYEAVSRDSEQARYRIQRTA